MKTKFFNKWIPVSMMILALTAPIVSCGDDDDDKNPGTDNPVGGGDNMTIEQNKQKMEAVAKSFMSNFNTSEWNDVASTARYISETYKNSDASQVDDWFETCLNDITSLITMTTEGNYTYEYYNRIWAASNFTGHFSCVNGRWTRTPADNLQVTCTDQNGQQLTATVTTSGTNALVHLLDTHEREYEYGYDYNYSYYYYYTYTEYRNSFYIPQNVTVKLTQGSTTLVNLTVKANITAGQEINLATDKFDVTVSGTVKNYDIQLSRCVYNGNGNAEVDFKLSKNGNKLLSVNVSGKSSLSGGINKVNFYSGSVSSAVVDILGEMQVKADCSDIMKLREYMEEADDNKSDEKQFKSYVNLANGLFNANIYYDGGSNSRASVKIEAFAKRKVDYSYNYNTGNYESWEYYKWYAEPVIYFADQTGYTAFEAFFNEDNFGSVKNTAESLIRDFSNLFHIK